MTDTITLPRSVLEQAISTILELEYSNSTAVSDKMARDSKAALRAALEQPQVEQEPVAWMWKFEFDEGAAFSTKEPTISICDGVEYVPLYTHPHPKSEPLTLEQILQIKGQFAGTLDVQFDRFARAIERAHGIVGE